MSNFDAKSDFDEPSFRELHNTITQHNHRSYHLNKPGLQTR